MLVHLKHALWLGVSVLVIGPALVASPAEGTTAQTPSLPRALREVKVPPEWIEGTPVSWDTNQPWKDARLEIRRLLALDEASVRQAVKLTWLYAQKGDIGDGHELPMHLFIRRPSKWDRSRRRL